MWTHTARNEDYQRMKVYKWHYALRMTNPKLAGRLNETLSLSAAGRLIAEVSKDYGLILPEIVKHPRWDASRGASNAESVHLSPTPNVMVVLHEMAHIAVMQRTPITWASCKGFKEFSPHGDLYAELSACLFEKYAGTERAALDSYAATLKVRRVKYGTQPTELNGAVAALVERFRRLRPNAIPTAPDSWIRKWNTQYGG
jgi:hypothetical protein